MQGLYSEVEAVLKIVEIMLVFSVSTAAVEKGFSTLNLIVTILRGQLSQGSKEKLLHISSTSPAIKDFDPEIILSFGSNCPCLMKKSPCLATLFFPSTQ